MKQNVSIRIILLALLSLSTVALFGRSYCNLLDRGMEDDVGRSRSCLSQRINRIGKIGGNPFYTYLRCIRFSMETSLRRINNSKYLPSRRINYQWGIDFQPLCASTHYVFKISDDFFLGAELGIGPEFLNLGVFAGRNFTLQGTVWSRDRIYASQNNPIFQIAYVHLLTRWRPKTHWFETDVGFRFASFVHTLRSSDTISSPTFIGLYLKPLVGTKKIKIGFRADFGKMLERNGRDKMQEPYITLSPCIRFMLIKIQ